MYLGGQGKSVRTIYLEYLKGAGGGVVGRRMGS